MSSTPDDGTVTLDEDEARVAFRRGYGATGRDVWDAMTNPERTRRWLGALHGDLREGGTYELRMGDDRPDADDVAHGEILRCDPHRLLELTWRFPGEGQSHVRVTVGDDGVLELVHTALEAAAARGYGAGWHVVLDQLDDHAAQRPVRPWDELWALHSPRYGAAG